jgi:hypothetical protein
MPSCSWQTDVERSEAIKLAACIEWPRLREHDGFLTRPAHTHPSAGGNSLFDALALAVWGTSALGPALRALGVQHAAAHPAEYRCFLGADWQAYLRSAAAAQRDSKRASIPSH